MVTSLRLAHWLGAEPELEARPLLPNSAYYQGAQILLVYLPSFLAFSPRGENQASQVFSHQEMLSGQLFNQVLSLLINCFFNKHYYVPGTLASCGHTVMNKRTESYPHGDYPSPLREMNNKQVLP